MLPFIWMSLPAVLPNGEPQMNMLAQGWYSVLTPTWARRNGSCWNAASAARRTFTLSNGLARWLKRAMYWFLMFAYSGSCRLGSFFTVS